MADPDSAWRYGLYTPPDVVTESGHTYDALEYNLLLPQIVRRMESVMTGAITGKDSKAAYDALRVYLMLYDKAKFNAADVKAWVLDDWAKKIAAQPWSEAYVYVKHDEGNAPGVAQRLLARLG